jgi:amino acid adenylation domain-containing protein
MEDGDLTADLIPLTESQREIWLATQMQPEANLAFNEGVLVSYEGALDEAALRSALASLLTRHALLRAHVGADGATLEIASEAAPEVRVHDFSAAPAEFGASRLAEIEREIMLRPFDLEKDSLIRFELVRTGPAQHYLAISAHHIVVDGWSFAVLLRELGQLYSLNRRGEHPSLPPAPQYREYIHREREFLGSPDGATHSEYWVQQMQNVPAAPQVPGDRIALAQRTYRGATAVHRLDASLVARLRQLGARQRATLVATSLSGFAALIARLSGETDLVIGLSAAGQSFYDLPGLVGHCVNMLPLRLKVDPQQSFAQLLKSVRGALLDAIDHQSVTYGSLLPKIQFRRDERRPPLISVVFNIDVRNDDIRHEGLKTSFRTLAKQAVTFEWFVNLVDDGANVLVECFYNADLYSPEIVAARLGEYETLLRSACHADEAELVANLALLSPERERQLLVEWNDSARDYALDTTLQQLINECARKNSQLPALVSERGTWSYAELDARARALAVRLQAEGVGPDRIVGVCAQRTAEMVVSLLGILYAGGAYLPLDPDYPLERLAWMVEDAKCPVVLRGPGLPAATLDWMRTLDCPVIDVDAGAQLTDVAGAGLPGTQSGADHLAYVIFTSGSTGRPKGALLQHRGVVNRILWMHEMYGIGPGDRVLQKTPYSFDVSVWEFFWPLMTGATLVLAKPDGHKDPQYLAEFMERERISTCHFVPSMLGLFLDNPQSENCRTLRQVFASGEALPYSQTQRFHERLPGARLHNLYGPTEASVDVSYWECPPDEPRRMVPIGRPVANTQLYVLDGERKPVPVGVLGELYLGGVQLARGYLERPDLTADRFVTHPRFGRLYRTGDQARWLPDGVVDFLGRLDGQVKLRGLRIELGEIETQLMGLPEIAEAVCAVRERSPGDQTLVGWVTARPGQRVDANAVREALSKTLPEYMLPQILMELAQFERLTSGKIDRKLLPDPFVGAAAERKIEPPVTTAEKAVAQAWMDVLGIAEIGRADRFIDLGGHSLLAVQVAALLQQRFGKRLVLRSVLMEPLSSVARHFDPSGGEEARAQDVVSLGSEVEQDAFFFGDPQRPLFGCVSKKVVSRKTAILICQSAGQEYMRSHRAVKLLSDRLACDGFPVMRFDYSCTGDSAGYSSEARASDWLDDIVTAARELRERSGMQDLCIIGLRLGGLLAAEAASRVQGVRYLAVWDAPQNGGSWLADAQRLNEQEFSRWNVQRARWAKLPPPSGREVLGMLFAESFASLTGLASPESLPAGMRNLYLRSADASDPVPSSACEVVAMPDESCWTRIEWLYTPWNPMASINQLAVRLGRDLQ